MNETKALAVIEREYGSLEEFAYAVLTQPGMRLALDETAGIMQRAEAVGLPTHVFSRILNSPAFRAILRTTIVNQSFGFFDEERHIKEIVDVATGSERKVMSPKGDIGYVDQAPGDIIAAGRYLNDLRGTSVEQKGGGSGGSISIQILNANDGQLGTATVAIEEAAGGHTPRGAGALPPPGVLQRGSRAVPGAALAPGAARPAPAAARADEPAAAGAHAGAAGLLTPAQPRADGEEGSIHAETERRALSPVTQGAQARRKLWEELPGREPPSGESIKPSRYGD